MINRLCGCQQRYYDNCGCEFCDKSSSESLGSHIYIDPSVTKESYIDYLLSSLSSIACLPDSTEEDIRIYWAMNSITACGDLEYTYLLTRKNVIFQLMSCAVFDVTRSESNSEANQKTVSELKADSESQAQNTSHNSSYSDSISESRYKDLSTGELRSESQRSAEANSIDAAHSQSDNVSHGESVSDSEGERLSRSDRITDDHSESQGQGYTDGARSGWDYSYSVNQTNANSPVLNIGFLGMGLGRTATKSYNTRIMKSYSNNSASTQRFGISTKLLDADASAQSWSLRVSSSFQNSIIDSSSWGRSQSEAFDSSRAQSDARSDSNGTGRSAAETEGRSTSSSQSTSQSLSTSRSSTTGDGHSYSISTMFANSDKFKHLKRIFENVDQLLTEFLAERRANRSFSIGPMLFGSLDGYCPVGAIERRLYRPGSVNGILCCPETPVCDSNGGDPICNATQDIDICQQ